MALDPSNSSNLEQLALKGLTLVAGMVKVSSKTTYQFLTEITPAVIHSAGGCGRRPHASPYKSTAQF